MRSGLASMFRAKKAGKLALVVAAAAAGVLAVGALQAAAASAADVLKVRLGGDKAETRIVLDVNRSVSGKLVSDGAGDGKVVLTLSDVEVPIALGGDGQGLVRRWSVEESGRSAKVTIELAQDAVVRRRFLLPPGDGVTNYRYVIDLKSARDLPAVRMAKATTAPKLAVERASAPRKRVVVIDAGHGGKDPGARGSESREKDITLASARALKARLEKSGRYKVVMTRDSDVFVPLETRVKLARKADADLFISLHADAGPDESTRGLSVYTLSEQGQDRAGRVMGKEDWLMNASHTGGNRAVSQILFDLTQRATKNRSAQFAEMLLERVSDETTLLRRSHRDAGFVVLLAPDVPAVLLEMGFITSPDDEKTLASADGRRRLMDAVGDSIDAYFAEQTRLASR
ncbi:MAG TPA: N-acetylmuramoyl-L-alanine amidase [Caulobacteraceae bacterium]|nr:N-acetylmuramoyl-L-alanine amidase [Caulobacteraceae bacterium]